MKNLIFYILLFAVTFVNSLALFASKTTKFKNTKQSIIIRPKQCDKTLNAISVPGDAPVLSYIKSLVLDQYLIQCKSKVSSCNFLQNSNNTQVNLSMDINNINIEILKSEGINKQDIINYCNANNYKTTIISICSILLNKIVIHHYSKEERAFRKCQSRHGKGNCEVCFDSQMVFDYCPKNNFSIAGAATSAIFSLGVQNFTSRMQLSQYTSSMYRQGVQEGIARNRLQTNQTFNWMANSLMMAPAFQIDPGYNFMPTPVNPIVP